MAAEAKTMQRQPTTKPPFTIGTLRKAIPAHCFERSMTTSFAYLGTDLAAVAALYFASTFFGHPAIPAVVRWGFLWPAYWVLQGAVGTGLWVIAHECGHQAFSKYQTVNDTVGLIVHTCLLVPYYSCMMVGAPVPTSSALPPLPATQLDGASGRRKHSHRRHHSNTGCMTKDEVFVPEVKVAKPNESEFTIHDYFWGRLGFLFITLIFGWPTYLLVNVTGRPYPRWANHFDPYSPIFSKRERAEVVISDVALVVVTSALWKAGQAQGFLWLLCTYGIPYLLVNHWLVMITLLQHTHPSLPHYNDKEWNWLSGALSTVDRSYGIFDHFHHHIADTHVAHHLFSQMPHYHAEEATRCLKPILGDYYTCDDREVYSCMWNDWASTQLVAPDTPDSGILWFTR